VPFVQACGILWPLNYDNKAFFKRIGILSYFFLTLLFYYIENEFKLALYPLVLKALIFKKFMKTHVF